MKFTLDWLKTHLDTKASPDEIAQRLTAIGLEVEEMVDKGALYAPFTIAEIKSTEKHPNADRLKICRVWTGSEELQIVCGAPNARAGIKVVLSRPGDFIPGLNVMLKASKIRDVESQGMMCSDDELCLAKERSGGIAELPADAPVGGRFADYAGLNQLLFEINLTPNRGDAASVYGVARDLAASGLGTLKKLDVSPVKGSFDSPVKIYADAQAGCPHFAGRYLRGVKNGASPQWMQERLKAIGLRPISALVDITNFLTHDLGRPLHVYDAKKVKGDLRVRAAKNGETLETLNGKTQELQDGMCVIADDSGIVDLAGIMGGASTGVDESTTDVLIESAWFDPKSIARTGRLLETSSDARYRFERGVDPAFTAPAIELATRLVLECCGGEASHVLESGAPVRQEKTIAYDPKLAASYGGIDIPVSQQKEMLQKLGLTVEEKNGAFRLTTPSWRPDLQIEVDCVEEVARLVGYDSIPPAYLPPLAPETPYRPRAIVSDAQALFFQAKRAMAASGFQEAVTWSFLPEKAALLYGPIDEALRLVNPISVDLSVMRPSIMPGLVMAAAANAARGFDAGALFELGPVFHGTESHQQPVSLAGLRFGAAGHRHWRGAHESRAADALDAKRDVTASLAALGFPAESLKLQAVEDKTPVYHPGQSGSLWQGNVRIARFGALHPVFMEGLDAAGLPVAAFEIDWPAVVTVLTRKKAGPARPLLALPELQPVRRDFAFLVADEIEVGRIVKAAYAADKTLIEAVRVFDVYKGKGVPEGHKSVAIEVVLQPREKTLTEDELHAVSASIAKAVTDGTGAQLRG